MTDIAPIDTAAQLARYIGTGCHARHHSHLPSLVGMAARVDKVHSPHAAMRTRYGGLDEFIADPDVNIRLDKMVLFPKFDTKGTAHG